jgi:poly-gamma-glutamate synthesis protein (capsule biosynthesis protein)
LRKILFLFLCGVSFFGCARQTNTVLAPDTTIVGTTAPNSKSPTTSTTSYVNEKQFTLAVTGDILPHSQLWRGAARVATANGYPDGYDFRPMFANVKTILSGVDLAICHLETPIAPPGEKFTTYPFFGVPSQITDAIAFAGFDRCSTASNHTMDRGVAGIDATVNALEHAGVSQAGMARTPSEIEPKVFEVNGVKVAHMSYTFSYNGLPVANGESWRSALINTDRILRDARQARKLGAEVVLVSMHWGNERESSPSAFQQRIADEITKTNEIDLIIGSHAHVLQPIEKVNDKWVIYGLGNFLSNMPTLPKDPPWPSSTQDGAIISTSISVQPDGRVVVESPVVTPTWVDRIDGWQIRSVLFDLNNNDIPPATRAALKDSLRRTTKVLGDFIAR